MQNFKLTVTNDTESLEAQALFQKLGFIQNWNAKKDGFDEPNHIFAGKGAITWLHNDRIAFENHPFEEITLQQLRKIAYNQCHVIERQETVIISQEFIFNDLSGDWLATVCLEENMIKHTGVVELKIGWYAGRVIFNNLKMPLKETLKKENIKWLILRAFQITSERQVQSGDDFITWIYQTGLQDIKKARKNGLVDAFDLRCAYDELKQIDGAKDHQFWEFAQGYVLEVLIKIYGEDYYEHLYPSIKDLRYNALAKKLEIIQANL